VPVSKNNNDNTMSEKETKKENKYSSEELETIKSFLSSFLKDSDDFKEKVKEKITDAYTIELDYSMAPNTYAIKDVIGNIIGYAWKKENKEIDFVLKEQVKRVN